MSSQLNNMLTFHKKNDVLCEDILILPSNFISLIAEYMYYFYTISVTDISIMKS